jgi:hypothetical protein
VTVAITNTAKGPQSFASANITIPTGFTPCTLCRASSSDYDTAGFSELPLIHNGDGTWTVPVRSGAGSGVAPGSTIHVRTWVTDDTVACAGASWPVAVKQSNDFSGTGNDFIGSPATPTGYLTFTVQPPLATAASVAMDPAPQVSSFDGCGAATAATITLSDTAGHLATGAGPLPSVATFTAVTFTGKDFTDQLVATASGYTSATSTPFLVAEKVQSCSSGSTDCQPLTLDSVSKTSASIIPSPPKSGSALASGSELGADNSMCGEAAAGIPDSEISATISFNAETPKTVTFTIAKSLVNAISNNGAPFMSVCLRTTDPDGTNHDVTLSDCFKGGVTTLPPCVVSRNKNQANEVIVVSLPPGDPHSNVY